VAEMPVEMPEQWIGRISETMGLAPAQAEQLLNRGQDQVFEALAACHDPKLVGMVLLSVLPELEREGIATDVATEAMLNDLLAGVAAGLYSKEAMPQVLGRMLSEDLSAAVSAQALGLGTVSAEDVAARVEAIVREREDFVRQKGMGAVGPLMGVVMDEFKGQVDGKELSRMLAESIDRLMAEG
jgi:glutamyl-tRNA(Gln) amidotransferase subunit E